MKLMIKSLQLKNFKGIKEFKMMFDSTRVDVYGANGTGKSTLLDAFLFVLTGLDTAGKKCDPIVIDENNNKVYGTNEVEILLDADGEEISLLRKVSSKCKDGKESVTYSYKINGATVPATKFETFLEENISSELLSKEFIYLIQPLAFQSLSWQQQRDFLARVFYIQDSEVLARNERLKFLEQFLKISDTQAFRKEWNAKAKELEVNILKKQGVLESLQIEKQDTTDLEAKKSGLLEELKKLEEELKNPNIDRILEINQLILEINTSKNAEIKAYEEEKTKGYNSATKNKKALQGKIEALKRNMEDLEKNISNTERTIESLNKSKEEFKERWERVAVATFREKDKICPTCKRELEEYRVKELVEDFNKRKLDKIEELEIEAKDFKGRMSTENRKIEVDRKMVDEIEVEKKALESEMQELDEVIAKGCEFEPYDGSSFDKEIRILEEEKVNLAFDDTKIKGKKCELQSELRNIDLCIFKIKESNKKVDERKALSLEVDELQSQLGEVKQEIELSREFDRLKAEMLEDKINYNFDNVKFKMFEATREGTLNETCVAMAYDKQGTLIELKECKANTALRYEAGIEIINTLQEKFDLYLPIWVDNNESVSSLPKTMAQLITLNVSEMDKKIRIVSRETI